MSSASPCPEHPRDLSSVATSQQSLSSSHPASPSSSSSSLRKRTNASISNDEAAFATTQDSKLSSSEHEQQQSTITKKDSPSASSTHDNEASSLPLAKRSRLLPRHSPVSSKLGNRILSITIAQQQSQAGEDASSLSSLEAARAVFQKELGSVSGVEEAQLELESRGTVQYWTWTRPIINGQGNTFHEASSKVTTTPLFQAGSTTEAGTAQSISASKNSSLYSEISYNAGSWTLKGGKFGPSKRRSKAAEQQGLSSFSQTELSVNQIRSLWPRRLQVIKQRRTRSTRATAPASKTVPKKPPTRGREPPKLSRIGAQYQAVIPSKQKQLSASDYGGQVLWDPALAARGLAHQERDVENRILQERDFATQMLLMECVSSLGYQHDTAMAEFEKRVALHPVTSSLEVCAANDKKLVEHLLARKDFSKIAKAFGCSREKVIVYYYRWKGRKRTEYEQVKAQWRKESDECAICNDGGTLIVCDRCRKSFHLKCLNPPLREVPPGDWYCETCMRSQPASLRRLPLTPSRLDTSPDSNQRTRAPTSNHRNRLRAVHKELFTGLNGKSNRAKRSKDAAMGKQVHSGKSKNGNDHSVSTSAHSLKDHSEAMEQSTTSVAAAPSDMDDDQSSSSSSISSVPVRTKSLKPKKTKAQDDDSSYHGSVGGETSDEESLQVEEKRANVATNGGNFMVNASVPASCWTYDVILPFGEDGSLGIKLGVKDGNVVFLDYGETPLGCIAKQKKLFRAVGDIITSIDGTVIKGKSFQEVLTLCKLRRKGQHSKKFGLKSNESEVAGRNQFHHALNGSSAQQSVGVLQAPAASNSTARLPTIAQGYSQVSGSSGVATSSTSNVLPTHPTLQANPPRQPMQVNPTPAVPAHSTLRAFAPHQPVQVNPVPAVPAHSALVAPTFSGQVAPSGFRQITPPAYLAFRHVKSSQRPIPEQVWKMMTDTPTLQKALNRYHLEPDLYESFKSDTPAFLTLLRELGLLTVQIFLSEDSERIANAWAQRTGLDRARARDFIGAMKFRVKNMLQR